MSELSRDLADLRLEGERFVRGGEHADMLRLADRLRADEELWSVMWAPSIAVAAAHEHDPRAIEFLREAVAGGFNQPDNFDGKIEECFADHPDWPELQAAMAAPHPSPWEIIDWPELTPHQALMLEPAPPGRTDELRTRLPSPTSSSWETARSLLAWATRNWEHANDHVEARDAVEVLDRAAGGMRFACIEYTTVLTQALNAVGIPARRLELFQAQRHTGFGRGHVVSEAWIDELSHWVLLDGQNGAWWTDGDQPLGVLELISQHEASGRISATMDSEARDLSDEEVALWSTYFDSALTGGQAWGHPFGGVFQHTRILRAGVLLHDPRRAYPDLDQAGVGLGGTRANPHFVLHTNHPYATGFDAAGIDLPVEEPHLPVDLSKPGTYNVPVRVRTPYGLGRERVIHHVVRQERVPGP